MYRIEGVFWNLLQLSYWMRLVQYTRSMRRYGLSANYIQLKDKAQNKGATLYIDRRPKITGNIAGFINNTQLGSTLKQPNYVFKSREGNHVFLRTIESIVAGEEMLIKNLPNLLLITLTSTIYPSF